MKTAILSRVVPLDHNILFSCAVCFDCILKVYLLAVEGRVEFPHTKKTLQPQPIRFMLDDLHFDNNQHCTEEKGVAGPSLV